MIIGTWPVTITVAMATREPTHRRASPLDFSCGSRGRHGELEDRALSVKVVVERALGHWTSLLLRTVMAACRPSYASPPRAPARSISRGRLLHENLRLRRLRRCRPMRVTGLVQGRGATRRSRLPSCDGRGLCRAGPHRFVVGFERRQTAPDTETNRCATSCSTDVHPDDVAAWDALTRPRSSRPTSSATRVVPQAPRPHRRAARSSTSRRTVKTLRPGRQGEGDRRHRRPVHRDEGAARRLRDPRDRDDGRGARDRVRVAVARDAAERHRPAPAGLRARLAASWHATALPEPWNSPLPSSSWPLASCWSARDGLTRASASTTTATSTASV